MATTKKKLELGTVTAEGRTGRSKAEHKIAVTSGGGDTPRKLSITTTASDGTKNTIHIALDDSQGNKVGMMCFGIDCSDMPLATGKAA